MPKHLHKPNKKRTWIIVCAVILAAAAVTVTLMLVEHQGQEDAPSVESEALSPSPVPTLEPKRTPGPSTSPTPEPTPTPPPTPTPHITPPADSGEAASGSDVILATVAPSTGSDLG